jgi:hypothetical protein
LSTSPFMALAVTATMGVSRFGPPPPLMDSVACRHPAPGHVTRSRDRVTWPTAGARPPRTRPPTSPGSAWRLRRVSRPLASGWLDRGLKAGRCPARSGGEAAQWIEGDPFSVQQPASSAKRRLIFSKGTEGLRKNQIFVRKYQISKISDIFAKRSVGAGPLLAGSYLHTFPVRPRFLRAPG